MYQIEVTDRVLIVLYPYPYGTFIWLSDGVQNNSSWIDFAEIQFTWSTYWKTADVTFGLQQVPQT